MAVLQSTLRVSLLDDVSKRAKLVSNSLKAMQEQSTRFMSPVRSMAAQATALVGAYVGVTAGFEGTYKAAADAQAALTEIGIKSNLSTGQLAQMQVQLSKLSPQVNQFATDLLSGIDVMTTMGASADDASRAIPAIGKTATATNAAIADLSSASVSAMQNLNVMPGQIQQMLEGMTVAGNAGAFELKDMAQYFPQLTASAKTLGMVGVPAVNDMAAALQIARRGAGDASTAANNLSDFMGKIVTPQAIKNFKKFGVDVTKELAKANKNGISPIEHFIKLIDQKTKGGRGELLTQIFGDKQTLDFIRPMIAGQQDYLRIRGEADRAQGAIAEAYNRRLNDANQKVKSVQISLQNLGTSIGNNLLGPVGEAANYMSNVFNTLDQRVTIFDQARIAVQGFTNGLGFKNGDISKMATEWRDFIFGVQDGGKAADDAGRIFVRFKEWGDNVRSFTDAVSNNPVTKFLGDIAPYALQAAAWSVGLGWLAGAVKALASSLFLLSGASTILGALKTVGTIADLATGGTFPVPGGGRGGSKPGPSVPTSVEPLGWWASAATWFKGLSIASAPALMSEALTFTPGKDLQEQIAVQHQFSEDMKRWTGNTKDEDGKTFWDRRLGASSLPSIGQTQAMDQAWAARSGGLLGRTTETSPGKQADDLGLSSSARTPVGGEQSAPAAPPERRTSLVPSVPLQARPPAAPPAVDAAGFLGGLRDLFAAKSPIPATVAAPPRAEGDPKPVPLNAATIAELIRPNGTQDVRVTNQQPVSVTVNAPISITGVSDPAAAAGAASRRLGEETKAAVESSFSD